MSPEEIAKLLSEQKANDSNRPTVCSNFTGTNVNVNASGVHQYIGCTFQYGPAPTEPKADKPVSANDESLETAFRENKEVNLTAERIAKMGDHEHSVRPDRVSSDLQDIKVPTYNSSLIERPPKLSGLRARSVALPEFPVIPGSSDGPKAPAVPGQTGPPIPEDHGSARRGEPPGASEKPALPGQTGPPIPEDHGSSRGGEQSSLSKLSNNGVPKWAQNYN